MHSSPEMCQWAGPCPHVSPYHSHRGSSLQILYSQVESVIRIGQRHNRFIDEPLNQYLADDIPRLDVKIVR